MKSDLSHHHRDTLQRILSHPASGNIEWRQVLSLLNARSDHLAENLTLLGDRGLVEIGPTPPGPRNPGGRYTLRARTGSFRFDSRQLTTRRAPRGQWAGLTAHREAFDRSGSARQRREARFVLGTPQ